MIRTRFQVGSFALASLFASTLIGAYAAESTSLARLMVEVINPAANTIWDAGPKDALSNNDWDKIKGAVAVLSATSAALSTGGSIPHEQALAKSPEWREWSQRFATTVELARRASDRMDQKALTAAGQALVDVCQGCHLSVAIGRPGA